MNEQQDCDVCHEVEGLHRADEMLASLPLTLAERRFATAVGEQVIDLVIEAHWRAGQQGERCRPAGVVAAVAYALAMLHDPEFPDGPAC